MIETPKPLLDIVERLELHVDEEVTVPEDPDTADPALVDLTHLPFVTIDNEDSRDLDQALFIERTDDGWLVRYAIADAAHFVRPGTELFEHALKRGTSFYFPEFAVPMLPRALSEGIVSLNPHVDRRALVFESRLSSSGEALGTKIVRARMRSRAKLSYDGVQRWFDDGAIGEDAWVPSLLALREVGEVRAERARQRGVVEYDRSEAIVAYDHERSRFTMKRRMRNDVEAWNEQLSLLCNTEGARLMRESDASLGELQTVYRVHLPPLQSRLDELKVQIAAVCKRHELDDAWRWDGETPLGEYLAELPEEPHRVRRAIQLQVRYTNRASEYTDRVGPHFALAVDQYARFSAPMREIVGIFTHKEALEALGFESHDDDHDDPALRAAVIDAANEAKLTQKRIDKEVMLLAIADVLAADLEVEREARRWRVATVIGLRPTRVYVLLDELPLELKLYSDDLEAAFGGEFTLTEDELRGPKGAPSFGLGDGVAVRVNAYDAPRRRYRFDVGGA